jgi:hypothetical protein
MKHGRLVKLVFATAMGVGGTHEAKRIEHKKVTALTPAWEGLTAAN